MNIPIEVRPAAPGDRLQSASWTDFQSGYQFYIVVTGPPKISNAPELAADEPSAVKSRVSL